MNSMRNSVKLIGNLGNDPKVIEFDNGKILARMTMATNEYYKDKNGEFIKQTQWHNLSAWGNTAEKASKFLHKGSQIACQGKISYREYEDKQGVKRTVTEIVVSDILMMQKKES